MLTIKKLEEVLKHIDGEEPHGKMILTDEHILLLIEAAKSHREIMRMLEVRKTNEFIPTTKRERDLAAYGFNQAYDRIDARIKETLNE